MHFNTFESLVPFTLFVILSTSIVVSSIPVQGQDAHDVGSTRSLAGVNGNPSFYRRGRPGSAGNRPTGSGTLTRTNTLSQSDTTNKRDIITVCHLPNAPKVASRALIYDTLYRRSGSTGATDDDRSVLTDFDPGYTHKVAKGPTITTQPIGGGTFGLVYPDPNNPGQVVKHLGSSEKTSSFFPFTPGQLRREVKYLQKAEQLIDYKYTVKPGGNELHEAWVWMKKVDGVSFKSLGFRPTGRTETLPVPKAFPRGNPQRKVFLDRVVSLTIAKVVAYATGSHVEHFDMNLGNIMIKFKAGSTTHEIESIDLVDWARARSVRDGCTPEKEQEIRDRVTPYFVTLY